MSATLGTCRAGTRDPFGEDPDVQHDLLFGRLSVLVAHRGELEVYMTDEGSLGADFLDATSGCKRRVTKGVVARVGRAGQFPGWGYVSPERGFVFRFVSAVKGPRPRPWVTIEWGTKRVFVPLRFQKSMRMRDGRPVAFRLRNTEGKHKGQGRLYVEHIRPADARPVRTKPAASASPVWAFSH